jgi:hypothetical protein
MKKNLLIVLSLLVLFGCASSKEYDYDNPFDLSRISLRTILGEKESYIDEEVVVGPLIIVNHDLSANILVVQRIDIKGDIETEVEIDVYYGQVEDRSTWVNSELGDILYIKGAIHYYKYSTNIYLHAHEIEKVDHKSIKD